MAQPKLRLDKWLWQARFFKTRSLSAKTISAGHVRLNSARATKPAQSVSPGDVLTFTQGKTTRVIRIDALGTRRGPAPEAQALYCDLAPVSQAPQDRETKNPSFEGQGRPTKKDRRALDLSRARALE
jgi:ribosome-associated heat shock protein Hsp15